MAQPKNQTIENKHYCKNHEEAIMTRNGHIENAGLTRDVDENKGQ
ncbi:MAG: hypothetical protein ABSF71_03440 [Terriglobia bacterium]|jgi:hypothetical protein